MPYGSGQRKVPARDWMAGKERIWSIYSTTSFPQGCILAVAAFFFFSPKKAPLANSCLSGFYSYRLLHVLMMAFSLALSSLGMIVVSFGCFCQPLLFPLFCPHLCKWPFIGLRLFTPFECAICVLLGL